MYQQRECGEWQRKVLARILHERIALSQWMGLQGLECAFSGTS